MKAFKNIIYNLINQIIDWYVNFGYTQYRDKYNIAESFRFNGRNILFYGDGTICCGDNSYVGWNSSIQSDGELQVIIGQQCSISHNVRMYTNSAYADQDNRQKGSLDFLYKNGNIFIANYVWIGANVFINPDISIGENCVVGANAVVTKSLPPHSICAGVPAKVIKFKSYLSDCTINTLAKEYYPVLSDKLKERYK